MIGYNLIASPGRLANQMFKYAALKGIANNRNFNFCIPPSYQIIEKNKIVFSRKINIIINYLRLLK